MTVTDVLQLLRPGLLEGRAVALAGPARPELAHGLTALGAATCAFEAHGEGAELDAAADAAARALGPVDALVVDAAARFAAAPDAAGELAPLRAAADGTWTALRAVANAAWIGPGRPGRAILVAPAPQAGPHAHAARAALENTARTTSIEWARHGITTVAITPGDATTAEQLAALAAYLVSPAGDYFSGCRLDLS